MPYTATGRSNRRSPAAAREQHAPQSQTAPPDGDRSNAYASLPQPMPTDDYSGRFHTPSLQAGTRRITTHGSVKQSPRPKDQRSGAVGLATARARSRCGDKREMPCGCGAANWRGPVASAGSSVADPAIPGKPVRSSWTRLKNEPGSGRQRADDLYRGAHPASIAEVAAAHPSALVGHRACKHRPASVPDSDTSSADRPPAWTRAGPHSAAWPRRAAHHRHDPPCCIVFATRPCLKPAPQVSSGSRRQAACRTF